MISILRSPRGCWLALGVSLGAILLMQLWAGVALRGLYADGAYYAQQLLFREAFVVIEPARRTSQILMQAPVVLAMRLGLDSPRAVALSFSLATNLMPLLLTLACVAVLPAAERAYGLFPLFVFLAASMSAAVASVADGPTAAAYTWLLLLLILFGPLTRLRLAAILLLAGGATRLHEAMAFLGPIVAFACLWRCRSAEGRVARALLVLAGLLILGGCAAAIQDLLHPRLTANRASFFNDVVSLRWLLVGRGQVSVTALAGMLAALALPAAMLRGRGLSFAISTFALLFIALTVLALAMPPCPPAAFAARNNGCLLSAPAMLLLLALRHRPLPWAPVAFITAMLGLAVATADGAATWGWLGYRTAMRAVLTAEHGVVPWPAALAQLPARQALALERFSWPWTTPLMSLWLAPGPAVDTVIANPAKIAWQPFDPETLRSRLGARDAAPTRPGFIALLRQ